MTIETCKRYARGNWLIIGQKVTLRLLVTANTAVWRIICSNEIMSWLFTLQTREDKTIESAVPFPAPEIGDNRGLSHFHPRIIIVIGECPLLSPVWKSSPLPRKPLKCLENLPPSPSPVTGAGTGKGTPSFNVLKEPNFHYFINLTWLAFTAASTV